MRPNHRFEDVLLLPGISGTITSHSLLRRKPGQTIGLLDQQLRRAGHHGRRTPLIALADRTVLQSDQAARPYQVLLRGQPKRARSQLRIAVATYLLVAIVRKKLRIDLPLYTILQILSLIQFGKPPLLQALSTFDYTTREADCHTRLLLLE